MELSAEIHLEQGSYWAAVPALPGCFASGDTLDELLASLRDGVELYCQDRDGPQLARPLQVKAAVLSDSPPA